MNNLPITMSAPPVAAKTAQAIPASLSANPAPAPGTAPIAKPAQVEKLAQAAKPAEDGATQGKSFGEVLARQVSDAESADETPQPKKASAKTAEDIFSNINAKTDDAIATTAVTPAPTNVTPNLPADMLATLVPQSAPVVSAQAAAIPQGTLTATEGLLPKKAGLPATASKNISGTDSLGVEQNSSVATNGSAVSAAPQIAAKKDTAFANMMETMTAATAPKLLDNDDKAAALAASPQPNAGVQAATLQAATAPLAPVNVMPAQVTINTPVSHEKWGDEFNQKITWLSNQKEQTAELHLNPPQLGPMDVVLKVSGDQATALFTSPHAAVREAVEQALPRLREMLADSGIMLGNATVSDQAPRNPQDSNDSKSSGARSSIGAISDSARPGSPATRVSPITRHNGIVDTFA